MNVITIFALHSTTSCQRRKTEQPILRATLRQYFALFSLSASAPPFWTTSQFTTFWTASQRCRRKRPSDSAGSLSPATLKPAAALAFPLAHSTTSFSEIFLASAPPFATSSLEKASRRIICETRPSVCFMLPFARSSPPKLTTEKPMSLATSTTALQFCMTLIGLFPAFLLILFQATTSGFSLSITSRRTMPVLQSSIRELTVVASPSELIQLRYTCFSRESSSLPSSSSVARSSADGRSSSRSSRQGASLNSVATNAKLS
mmetsp:Transcript_38633/g.91351  ORF Transcript_38633/g.91351 Transcript_38633/m.91351 type:complete len:261 (-) Transcript_38633:954-1736(-)